MLRGITTFRCPICGKEFKALDIEDNATAGTMPLRCPECGAMRHPKRGRLSILFKSLF